MVVLMQVILEVVLHLHAIFWKTFCYHYCGSQEISSSFLFIFLILLLFLQMHNFLLTLLHPDSIFVLPLFFSVSSFLLPSWSLSFTWLSFVLSSCIILSSHLTFDISPPLPNFFFVVWSFSLSCLLTCHHYFFLSFLPPLPSPLRFLLLSSAFSLPAASLVSAHHFSILLCRYR